MSDYREIESTEEAEKMLSVSVVISTLFSYQENSQERDSARGVGEGRGVSNTSLFISIRAISLSLEAASVLVCLNGLDANQKAQLMVMKK
jgi:hypothetical protein